MEWVHRLKDEEDHHGMGPHIKHKEDTVEWVHILKDKEDHRGMGPQIKRQGRPPWNGSTY